MVPACRSPRALRASRRVNLRPSPIEALESRRLLAAIVSGERVLGSIAAPAETVEYTFTASAGDSIVLSLGELTTNWAPRLTVLAPDNSQVGIASGSTSFLDANLKVELLTVAQAGTYTAVVGSTGATAGAYALSMAKLPGTQTFDDGPIVSGERKLSTLDRGDLDIYTFTAAIGDSLIVSIGELNTNWAPRVDLYGPDGAQLRIISGSTSFADANLHIEQLNVTQSGTYYLVAQAAATTVAGDYALTMARLPGAQAFDSGPLVSGQRKLSTLDRGDLEVYTFTAAIGDSLLVSIGELNTNWAPRVDLYGPDGARLGMVSGSTSFVDANLQIEHLNATQNGTYYVVVRSANTTVAGEYGLTIARLPGAQPFDQGPLVSGQRKLSTLDRGDLDIYTFTANAGDSVIVSIGELNTNWAPWIDVFGPNGTRLGANNGSGSFLDANVQVELLNLTTSGTYYVVARAAGTTVAGDYALTMAKLPGAQPFNQGPIASGERKLSTLDRGDLDVYSFTANAGDSVIVSIGELNTNWAPRIDVFGPSGARLGTSSGSGSFLDANVQVDLLNLTAGGTYYVVARAGVAAVAGDYALSIAKVGGAQPFDSGPLLSGQRQFGTIDRGDLDVYTFTAGTGDSVIFSIGELTTNWAPRIDVFGPNGARLDTNSGAATFTDANIQVDLLNLTAAGTYYLVARAAGTTNAGDYALSFAKFPGAQSPDTTDNDGGPIASGQTTTGAIAAGDFDVYTLNLTLGDSVQVQMTRLTSTFSARLDLFGPTGTRLLTNAGATTATVTLPSAPATGTYYAVARTNSTNLVGNYSIGVNVAPGPDTRPPEVTLSEFRWNVPRQQVVFRMNENVAASLDVADLTLQNLTTGETVPAANISATFNTFSNEILFEFPGYLYRALPDGNYRATLNAGGVIDTAGNALPSNASFEFFSLAGDANRDRKVDVADLGILASNWQRSPRTFSQADFNYDGVVDVADLGILASAWQKELAAPAPAFAAPVKSLRNTPTRVATLVL